MLLLVVPLRAQGDPPARTSAALQAAFAEPCSPVELRRRLAQLPAADLPDLFRLVAVGALPRGNAEMSPEQRRVARESLATRSRRELLPFLEALAAGAPSDALRLEAQRLVGATGTADHLRLLARTTCAPQERGGIAPALRGGFTDALAAILAREPAAVGQVSALFGDSPPGLSGPIVEALARQPSTAATRMLARLLGRSPGLDLLLLVRLSDRERPRPPDDEPVLDAVRRYLRQRDSALASAAIRTVGRLGDHAAVEELVALAEGTDERTRACALEALGRITGLGFGKDANLWGTWFRAETRWWNEEAEALLLLVERGRGPEFVRAARAVLEHRLHRDRIAQAFAHALNRSHADELLLACRALEQLRATHAVPALVGCLDHPDALVRQAAWKALRTLTGAELPLDAAAWARFELEG